MPMKNDVVNLFLVFTFFMTTSVFSQDDTQSCSFQKNRNKSKRSATLTVQQIKETEKYDVTYYKINLEATNLTSQLKGDVEMFLTAKEQLDTVVYELFKTYAIDFVLVNGDTTKFRRGNSALYVPVKAGVGEKLRIKTSYTGTAPSSVNNPFGGGGYTSSYVSAYKKRVSWTLSDPFFAYEWLPCKQSLTDKIDSVSIAITAPDSCMVGANGILQKVTVLPGNKKRFEWKHNYPIEYYLICFSISDYIEHSTYAHPKNTVDSVLIQHYIYNNASLLSASKPVLDKTAAYLNYYSELFTLYPFHKEKYGHCMAPIGGGMEHQTMTTLGAINDLLIAHELAHQWWGNHVTYASWPDVWLSEGFATYAEYLALEKLAPGLELPKLKGFQTSAISLTNGSVWVKDSLNPSRIFSRRLTYDKGAAIIHMLRYLINNDSLFFAGLRSFQTKFAFSTASVSDFKLCMETVAKIDLTAYFNEWYYGEGYPIYSAQLQQGSEGKKLILAHRGSSSTTPLFTMPIEILFSRYNNLSDTILRFDVKSTNEVYAIPDNLMLSVLKSIDPRFSLLRKVEKLSSLPAETSLGITIYPNPASKTLFVSMEKPGFLKIKLIDLSGRVVLENDSFSPVCIPLNGISAGVYEVLIAVEDEVCIRKLWVE